MSYRTAGISCRHHNIYTSEGRGCVNRRENDEKPRTEVETGTKYNNRPLIVLSAAKYIPSGQFVLLTNPLSKDTHRG